MKLCVDKIVEKVGYLLLFFIDDMSLLAECKQHAYTGNVSSLINELNSSVHILVRGEKTIYRKMNFCFLLQSVRSAQHELQIARLHLSEVMGEHFELKKPFPISPLCLKSRT